MLVYKVTEIYVECRVISKGKELAEGKIHTLNLLNDT